jgi:hypothetical protein
MNEQGHSAHLRVDGRVELKWILDKFFEKMSIGFIWLRIRASDRLL